MNRKHRRARAAMHRSSKFIRDYVAHLPEVDPMDFGPGVYHLIYYHDSWCGIYKGNACNCEPDVRKFREPRRS